MHKAEPHESSDEHPRICICVRKRPISDKERQKCDHDSVTCFNPEVTIHSAKFRVDGITKYLDHTSFKFDHAFDESVTTDEVYRQTTMSLIDFVCSGIGGRATVFAYGQTGSGKTYTMNGIQSLLVDDLFLLLSDEIEQGNACTHDNTIVMLSFFELYGGYVQDLLNSRQRLKVLEDGKGEVVITGLSEVEAGTPEQFLEIVQQGNKERTTHTTEANDTSSRSHAICQITLRDRMSGNLRGKLSLVDLAGSERGSDTKSHNAQRRAESAEINTSLLSLKECIRALDRNAKGAKHVPYRGSKLTLILKDCFTSDLAMTTMIATVSPGASAADHSLNTLRYADRIKEKRLSVPQNSKHSLERRSLRQMRASVGETKAELQERENVSENEGDHGEASLDVPEERVPESDADLISGNDEEDDLVRALYEQEEAILNLHMNLIAENAQLLSKEGSLLQDVQRTDVSDEEIENYVSALEEILDLKEDMIIALQEKVSAFQNCLFIKS